MTLRAIPGAVVDPATKDRTNENWGRASANLLAQASTLDMSRPPWRHDRLPDGRPGASTVKPPRNCPPCTGKSNCWKERRILILTSNTNMSQGSIQGKIRLGTPGLNHNKDETRPSGKNYRKILSFKILSIDFLCFLFLKNMPGNTTGRLLVMILLHYGED